MKTEDFDYNLPKDLIAYYPKKKRDESRLLVLDREKKTIDHRKFFEITDYLKPDDLIVLNDTKVLPAKIVGSSKKGKEYEILLTERLNDKEWKILMRGPKDGIVVTFHNGLLGEVKKHNSKDWLIKFDENIDNYLDVHGSIPLPPYIDRKSEENDKKTYQTVYAKKKGAIAAPTAGLHFTEELLSKIANLGVEIRFLTLHVGIGTFRPVKCKSISDHKMDNEFVEISFETSNSINLAKKASRRIVAVGTTVVRALESAANEFRVVKPGSYCTDLFIYPPYEFKVVDAMATNFHFPRSTLLMLVSAFTGRDLLFKAYDEAIDENYRFLSYGDAMFIN